MGLGSTLANLWNAATDDAKAAATKTAQSAKAARDYVEEKAVEGYQYGKAKAVEGYQYGKAKAVEGYQYGKAKAVEARDYAKEKAVEAYDTAKAEAAKVKAAVKDASRATDHFVVDHAADAGAAVAEFGRKVKTAASAIARGAYNAIANLFGLQPIAQPVQPCAELPVEKDDHPPDMSIDGWIMIPRGDGKCKVVPPSGADRARSETVHAKPANCQKDRETCSHANKPVIYVNGINTTATDHCQVLNEIAQRTCGNVIGVYNATAGSGPLGFARDTAQAGQDRRLIKQAAAGKDVPRDDGRNPAVDTLSHLIANEAGNKPPPELWAHSQGGAIASLALYEANNDLVLKTGDPAPLSNLKVKSFGSAAPQWVDGPQYQHYVHVNDLTPTWLGLGPNPKSGDPAAGKNAEVVAFSGDPKSGKPFETENLEKDWLPEGKADHGMHDTYLKMEQQNNRDCQWINASP
jgi:hypothetical protein